MSLYKSFRFSIKMILKNKQRTLTMALGIMIAIGLVIGVLGYIDYSQNEVITRAVQDIPVDMTVFQQTPSVNDVAGFQSLLAKYPYPSFINGSQFIEATSIIGANTPGVIIPTNSSSSTSSTTNTTTTTARGILAGVSDLLHGTPAVLYGVNFSYFQTFSNVFRVVNNSASAFTNSTVFVSSTFSQQTGINQNADMNLTIQSLNVPSFQQLRSGSASISVNLLNQGNFTVSGIVDINSNLFQQSTDSFTAPSTSSSSSGFGGAFIRTRLQRLSDVAIFMDINTFNSFVNASAISFGAYQLKINHAELSADTTTISTQISQLQNYIQTNYPTYTIVSDLQNAITAQATQLNNLRLTLIYLTLPSIFIGFMLTKYATDLVLLERKKEITALRAKSLSQTQIRDYVVIESLMTALIGTFLGILIGYIASFLLNNFSSNFSNISFVISENSILFALLLGVGLAVVSGLYTANSIMKQSIIEGLRTGTGESKAFWKRYYIDIGLLGIGVIFSIFSIINFNPIPGFAAAAFDLLVPITTWIGAALFLVRILEVLISKLEPVITKVLNFLIGDLGGVITKNIVRKPEKFSQLTIILILVLSFGIVVGSISQTYQVKASQDASFAVGSDFRIDLPATDQLTYNTSSFLSLLQTQIPDVSFTPVIVTTLRVGIQAITTVGINTTSFLSGAYFQNSFLQSGNSSAAAMQYLSYNASNPKVILSNAVANPSTGNRITQGRFSLRQNPSFSQFANFVIGGTVRAPIDGQLANFTISDISYYFPAISNLLNQPADSMTYAVVDSEVLTQPLTGFNTSILSNSNSTFFLGTYTGNRGVFNSSAIAQEINNIYNTNFPGAYPIVVNTQVQYLANSTSMGNLLLDLASLELFIVLIVTIFALGIYTTTTLFAKKKVFGTLNALGAKLLSIWYMITGEMLIGILYSIVISLFLGLLVSYTYLGFISNLFILPYISLQLSLIYSGLIFILAIIGLIIISGYAVQKVFRLEPVEALREL